MTWTYRDTYRNRSANYTAWDALHDIYAPGSKSAGERSIVSRIIRGFARGEICTDRFIDGEYVEPCAIDGVSL